MQTLTSAPVLIGGGILAAGLVFLWMRKGPASGNLPRRHAGVRSLPAPAVSGYGRKARKGRKSRKSRR
jgi:hypothetical protein